MDFASWQVLRSPYFHRKAATPCPRGYRHGARVVLHHIRIGDDTFPLSRRRAPPPRVSDALDPARRPMSRRVLRDAAPQVRAAGAFTKLIEIPVARGVAKGLMVPARRFMDGASAGEDVLSSVLVRVEHADVSVPPDAAPLLPLSGYDVGEVPFVMQAVCYYRETLDVGLLESALRQTLARYPILAGRLDLSDPDPSRKGIRLTNDGVPFRVVADHTPFDQLPQDYADESRRFLDYEPWIDIMLGGAPEFTAKVTQLSGGGSALGVCMSHAVSDGQGFVEFLVAWAERAAGRDHPIGDPVFDRSLLPRRRGDGSGRAQDDARRGGIRRSG